MKPWKMITIGLCTAFLLSVSTLPARAEEESGGEESHHQMTYEEAVKATENDCCR